MTSNMALGKMSQDSMQQMIKTDRNMESMMQPRTMQPQTMQTMQPPIKTDRSMDSMQPPMRTDRIMDSMQQLIKTDRGMDSMQPPMRTDRSMDSMQQLIKSDRGMFMSSDDSAMMRQIQTIHAPDGREIDVRPIFQIVEDILGRATMHIESIMASHGVHAHIETMEDKTQQTAAAIYMLEALSYLIERIASEIVSKCLSGMDGHQTTVSVLNLLASYSWEAKLVITLASFSLDYGQFWLLAHIYTTNQLAKSMATLRQLPAILEHSVTLKPRFNALNNLTKAILDLSRCIVAFKDLPSAYFAQEVPALSSAKATIPTAVYWTIRGVVACTSQITSLTSMGHEYVASNMEAWELSTLAHKINSIHDHLRQQLEICYQIIDEKRNHEAYETLQRIFEVIHIDNMKVLKALIYAKEDLQPLYDGANKIRVNLEVLRRRNVLLLISGLDFSQDELSILEQIYSESRPHATRLDSLYEVVWIPIVDRSMGQWTDPMQKQFESLQSTMTWYTVHHPTLIDRAVIKFIKEKWHFRNKPILVVLDPQGRVVSPNAIHMMWIWGSNAFPFTSLREEALWKEETWRLELLVNGIDPTILNWIKEGKYIFLYGGDDIDWIRRFTATASNVAKSANIPLEMVYVGKSSKKEQVRRIISIVNIEKLSHTWQDLMIWFFWTRLESMLFSKIQLGRADDTDPMMQEIKKLLSYDKSGGWAVLCKGSDVVVNGHGTTVLPTLIEYDVWKERVAVEGFDKSLSDHHKMHHGAAHPCCRFEFPTTGGRIPETMKCPECLRVMERYTSFLCCHDENPVNALY